MRRMLECYDFNKEIQEKVVPEKKVMIHQIRSRYDDEDDVFILLDANDPDLSSYRLQSRQLLALHVVPSVERFLLVLYSAINYFK